MFKKIYYPHKLEQEAYGEVLFKDCTDKYPALDQDEVRNNIKKIITDIIIHVSYAVGANYRAYDTTFDILLNRFSRPNYHIKDDAEKDKTLIKLFWLRRGNPPSIEISIGEEKWNQLTEEQQKQVQELTISATKRAINEICTTTRFMLERENKSINTIIQNRENIENVDDKWQKMVAKRNSLPKVPDFK